MDHHWDCRSWLQKPSTEIKWSKHVAKSSDSWLAAFRFVVSWTHLISLHQKKVPRATVHYLSEVTIRTILHTQVCPKILCPKIQRLHGKSSHYPHYVSKSYHFPHISPKFESKTPPFFRTTPTFPKIQRLNFQRESGGVPTTSFSTTSHSSPWNLQRLNFHQLAVQTCDHFGSSNLELRWLELPLWFGRNRKQHTYISVFCWYIFLEFCWIILITLW